MDDWFLAQVKPNADSMAKRNLERQGFSTFQPLERRTIVKGGRIHEQVRPFFASYVFISYSGSMAPWSLVNSTYGVSRLVKFGDRPAPVPPKVLADLRAACDLNDVVTTFQHFDEGMSVEVTAGAFANFVGRVERLVPGERAMVLLEFMGTNTRVALPRSRLRTASNVRV